MITKIAWSLLAFSFSVFAGFEEGVDAFMRGDYPRAANEWAPLAKSGDPDAARNLARLYHEGLGVRQDFSQARKLYQVAAKKCNATAQNNLGLLLLNGQGGEKDPVEAFRLFHSAANQGLPEDSDAMGNLGGLYLGGTGTQQNVVEAYKWYYLYMTYTTNGENRRKLQALLPQIEAQLSSVQKSEAIRRAQNFRPARCTLN